VDYSPEWRYYNSSDNKNNADPTRCGNPINPLLIESSFGCKIVCDHKSSFEMKRIRKWTEWTSAPHHEKSLYEEFQFITIMAQNSGIPKIFIDYAMIIHKDISEQKMFRGMNRDGIKAASIYISCRLNGCPRTAHEIAEIFKLDKQSTTNGCSNAVKILNNVERNLEYSQKSDFKVTTASSFIERYCSRLTNLEDTTNNNDGGQMNYMKNMKEKDMRNSAFQHSTPLTTDDGKIAQKPTGGFSPELTALSKFIALKIEKMDILCNSTPQSAAAGIIYFISQSFHLGISKTNIKIVCGVSEVTIGKCCKKLEAMKDKLIPQCILKKYGGGGGGDV
jgi:transcription initiation factor TFIIIB Brf1 subunit/transcription initiation factor TFIIB